MTQYFDTHAHYDSGKFKADRSDVLRAAHESGVALIVDPGDCAATSARAVAIAAVQLAAVEKILADRA